MCQFAKAGREFSPHNALASKHAAASILRFPEIITSSTCQRVCSAPLRLRFCCQTEAPCKACAARAPRGHVRSPHVGLGSLHTLPTCQPTAATEKVLVRSISPSRAPQLAADEEARGRRNRRAGLPVALKSRLWRSYHGWSARAPTGLADLLS